MTTVNPFALTPPAPSPAWVSVAPVEAQSIVVPPGTAVDKSTGEIIMQADGKTPYNIDALLVDWRASKDALDDAKSLEADLRGKVVAAYTDPDKDTGTENVPIGNGWFVKVAKKLNFTLKSFDEGVSNRSAVERALGKIAAAVADSQGNELNPELGKIVAMRLVKWEPELSITEYKQLWPGYREIIDTVLEVKPGAPTVMLVPPKESKK